MSCVRLHLFKTILYRRVWLCLLFWYPGISAWQLLANRGTAGKGLGIWDVAGSVACQQVSLTHPLLWESESDSYLHTHDRVLFLYTAHKLAATHNNTWQQCRYVTVNLKIRVDLNDSPHRKLNFEEQNPFWLAPRRREIAADRCRSQTQGYRAFIQRNTTLTEEETWKWRMMVHINPRVSFGFPSAMSSFLMFTSLTWENKPE